MPRTVATTDAFHAIAESSRRAILDRLREGERPVGELVEATGRSYPLVSHHLGVLLGAGVVGCRPEGRQRIYRLEAAPLRAVHDWTADYERFWGERLAGLRRSLER
ncbi:MAG: metalloregulator ArsR/SmtB family transcription factor [Solirubrobacteraceae bacterium]